MSDKENKSKNKNKELTPLQSIRTDNPSRKMGGEYNPEDRETKMNTILEMYADAYTISEIAKKIGISRVVIYEWKKTYPLFAEALEESRQQSADFYLRCLRDSAEELNPKSIALGLHYTKAIDNTQKHEISGNIGVIEFRTVGSEEGTVGDYAEDLAELERKYGKPEKK